MATEKRLIDAHDLWSDIMMLPHNGDMISSEEVEQAIIDAPTVDAVEVVHGRWDEVTGQDEIVGEMDFYKCSVCCKLRWFQTNYCPNCGAKMDGDGDG